MFVLFIYFELQSCTEHFLLPERRASLSRTAAYRIKQALLVTPIVTYHTFLTRTFLPKRGNNKDFFIFGGEISELRIE